jgi:hypothetical protein
MITYLICGHKTKGKSFSGNDIKIDLLCYDCKTYKGPSIYQLLKERRGTTFDEAVKLNNITSK